VPDRVLPSLIQNEMRGRYLHPHHEEKPEVPTYDTSVDMAGAGVLVVIIREIEFDLTRRSDSPGIEVCPRELRATQWPEKKKKNPEGGGEKKKKDPFV